MIAAVVPAAGRSVRMGRPKLLLDLGGETLIRRVVIALRRGGVGRVIVVAPPVAAPDGEAIAAEADRAGAEVRVPETQPAEMRESVELGLAALESGPTPGSVLLTPGDVPGITPDLVALLLRSIRDRPDCLFVPTCSGRRGHPIVLPWNVARQIPALPRDAGVNLLVARHRDRLIEVPVPMPGAIEDLDTPEELARWMAARAGEDPRGAIHDPEPLDRAPHPDDTMRVRVRLFALAKDRAGRPELELELPPVATVAALREALRQRLPELGPLCTSSMIAVDEEYADDDAPVTEKSRLAVIPPVSGGQSRHGDCTGSGGCRSRDHDSR